MERAYHLMFLFAALGAGLLVAAPAAAQSTEYILDDEVQGADDPWTVADAPVPGTDEAVLAEARRLTAEGRPGKAKAILDRWIDQNEATRNPFLSHAYLLRGDALLANTYEYHALYDYETVIRDFSASDDFVTAVEREYEIGLAYITGLKRRWFGLIRIESSRALGEELLIRVQERLPGSELAERAAIELADHYYRRRDLELAQEMYSIFLQNYPSSEHRKKASLRQIYCAVARFKGPRYDASTLIDAQILIRDFRGRFPADAAAAGITEGLLNRIDESAAQQMLDTGMWYLRRNDEPSSRFTLRRLLRRHPGSAAAAEAVRVMQDRGWLDEPADVPTPAPSDEPNVEPTITTETDP